jgi:2-oxoisovalerate dehydrogenase E1 component beta subunit
VKTVAAEGGVFRATDGLLKRFGPDRVLDISLAENAIAGLSVGLAAQGFRPVAEIQFTGFIYPAIDQLVNQCRAPAHPNARAAQLPDGRAVAGGRRHPRHRAPFGEPRGDLCSRSGSVCRDPVLGRRAPMAVARRNP